MSDKYFQATDPEASVYVDASAGSGKTKLLIDRMVRILWNEDIKPSKILCITFTNAATDEMTERLHQVLFSLLTASDVELREMLYNLNGYRPSEKMLVKARGLFHKCIEDSPRIQTIHSFCSTILQKMFVINSVDDLQETIAKIITDEEKTEILHNIFTDVISNHTPEQENERMKESLEILLDKYDVSHLFDLILDLWNSLSSNKELCDLFSKDTENFDVLEILKEKVHSIINTTKDIQNTDEVIENYLQQCDWKTLEVVEVILLAGENITSKKAGEILQNWLPLIIQDKIKRFQEYTGIFLTSEYKPRARLPLNANMSKKYPEIQEFMLQEQERLFLTWDVIHTQECTEINLAFSIFAWHILQKYNEYKRNNYLFEYGDLVRYTVDLIRENGLSLLYSIDMMIDHIMIDEAQDLSIVQWAVIHAISEEFYSGISRVESNRTIFIVGDFKQAIFSFQGAAPKVFQDIRYFYREKFHQVNKKWYEIQLDKCFRCTPEILEVVDRICNTDDVREAFGIEDKHGDIKHISVHSKGHGKVMIHTIDTPQKKLQQEKSIWIIPSSDEKIEDQDDDSSTLAISIAEFIASTCNSKKYGPDKLIAQPSDILVLLRKRSKLQTKLVDSLKRLNIPVTNLAAQEPNIDIFIYDVIAAIYFAVQPLDDMNLVALLKTQPFNLDEESIMKICSHRKNSVWNEICSINGSTFEYQMSHNGLAKVKKCHQILLNIILAAQQYTKPYLFCRWCFNNIFTDANFTQVNSFMQYIFAYNSGVYSTNQSLQGFVIWMMDTFNNKQQEKYDKSSVRITTVHSAKGLEAPIVILADAAMSNTAKSDKIMFNNDYFLLHSGNKTNSTIAITDDCKKKAYAENQRLLYVALTRAKYELHIFGMKNNNTNLENSNSSWYNILIMQ